MVHVGSFPNCINKMKRKAPQTFHRLPQEGQRHVEAEPDMNETLLYGHCTEQIIVLTATIWTGMNSAGRKGQDIQHQSTITRRQQLFQEWRDLVQTQWR